MSIDKEELIPYVFKKDGKSMFVKIPSQYYMEIGGCINRYIEDQPEKDQLYEVHAYDHTLVRLEFTGVYAFVDDERLKRHNPELFYKELTQEEINQANRDIKGIDFNYFKTEV